MGGCQWGSIPTADPHQANHREALNHTHTHTEADTRSQRYRSNTRGHIYI